MHVEECNCLSFPDSSLAGLKETKKTSGVDELSGVKVPFITLEGALTFGHSYPPNLVGV